jgi:hypothetical protein
MNHAKMIRGLFSGLILSVVLISCNSAPEESEFTKTAREVFFDVDLSIKYDDALSYYKSNSNLVDVKMFDSTRPGAESKHQFIFQKHPLVKQGLKAGSLYVYRRMDDSANFQQTMYFLSQEDALKSFQAIDQHLRKSANHVVTSDSADRKMVIYSAGNSDHFKAIIANLGVDSLEGQAQLKLNLVKSQN